MPITCGTKNNKKRQVSQLISNQDMLKIRLSQDEVLFYTELFYDNSKEGKVSRENFYPLLGALGTQISKEFTDRLFTAFSSNKTEITLNEYLKYLDIYHYGDDTERCTLTCKLMNPENERMITLEHFTNYINLIMNAVKKVTYDSNQELMSKNDINDLFCHISKKKDYFTLDDFIQSYRDKPELISWFDYFKNNKSDLLLTIDDSIKGLLNLIYELLDTFMNDLVNILDNKKKIDVKTIIQNVRKYIKKLEFEQKQFLQKISQFNIRWALEQSNNIEKERQHIIDTLENKLFSSLTLDINNKEENNNEDKFDKFNDINFKKEDNKYNSIISSNSKKEKLINNDWPNSNRDSMKKVILNEDKEDNDDINSNNGLIKNIDIRYNTFNINDINQKEKKVPLFRTQTKKVLTFFNNMKEDLELTKKVTFLEKEEENSKMYDENKDYYDNNIDEVEDKNYNSNLNYNNNHHFPGIKSFQNEEKNEQEKYHINLQEPFEEQKEYIKEEEDNNITKENDNNNINNNINNIINNNKNNINFNKTKMKTKNSNIYYKSNSGSNTNNTNIQSHNKDILNMDNIKVEFNLKGTYKTEDANTIYNDSDVESEFTLLEDKMLNDDNILYGNDINNNNVLIKEAINKNFNSLKQLLFCSRAVIKSARDIILTFSYCYNWIKKNYLKEHIKKKKQEIKKEEKRKKEKAYNTKNNVARKKKEVKKKIIRTPDESFKILLNIIMGIQIAVKSCPNFKFNNDEDISKYLNTMVHSIQTINFGKKQEEIFFLKEFAGIIFNNIRLLLGINKESFISSISPQEFVTELMISSQTIFEELCSTGKSGSLFYYTRDGRFIVKTISKKEYKFLKKVLALYYKHLKNNPMSLLPKFLGCYKLIRKVKKKKYNIYFIVMINVFATSNHIDKRYDLKGSKIGRRVLKGSDEDKKIIAQGDMALKDLDFENKKEKIYIGKKKDIIISQLESDTKFLEEIGANDYSLLLGIHNFHNKTQTRISAPFPRTLQKSHTVNFNSKNINLNFERKNSNLLKLSLDKDSEISNDSIKIKNNKNELFDFEDGGILSANGENIYYIGIIDILTEYGFVKKTEHLCKMIRYCSENMSCIPPDKYKERYINYMRDTVFDDTILLIRLSLNNEDYNTHLKTLCCSQNLNNALSKINNNNKEFNEDNKSEKSNKLYEDNFKNNIHNRNKIKINKNNNIKINSERVESDHRLTSNLNNIKNSIKSSDNNEINDKYKNK